MNKKSKILLVCGSILAIILGAWTAEGALTVKGIEEPPYTVVKAYESFDVREYDPMVIATVRAEGRFKDSANAGFRKLAAYIFGGNKSKKKEGEAESIPMTAPVMQEKATNDAYDITFVMPRNRTLNDLPKPNSASINLQEVPKRRLAVYRFSGFMPGEERVNKLTDQLRANIKEAGVEMVPNEKPIISQYNPPWTLPFMRRNEIMIPVK